MKKAVALNKRCRLTFVWFVCQFQSGVAHKNVAYKKAYVSPKHILKSKARDQSIQAKKRLFFHMIVKNYLCDDLCKLLIKIESKWMCEIKSGGDFTMLWYNYQKQSRGVL